RNRGLALARPLWCVARELWTLDARPGTLEARPGILEARRWILDARRWTLHARRWMIDRERLELRADSLARGDAFGTRDVVALSVPREEAIARSTEPLPDRLGARFLHRTDGFPLRLQPFHLDRGRIPLGRLGERLGSHAERLLFRKVLRPHRLPLGQIVRACGEESIARRAEPFPDSLFLSSRHRTDGFPRCLQRLDLLGGLNP